MKQRKDFCKKIKRGEKIDPKTPFEINYYECYKFKRDFRKTKKPETLKELKRLSAFHISGTPQAYERRRLKKHPIRKSCFVCRALAFYQHHIILLKNGGYDNGMNRIPICNSCHKELHNWL